VAKDTITTSPSKLASCALSAWQAVCPAQLTILLSLSVTTVEEAIITLIITHSPVPPALARPTNANLALWPLLLLKPSLAFANYFRPTAPAQRPALTVISLFPTVKANATRTKRKATPSSVKTVGQVGSLIQLLYNARTALLNYQVALVASTIVIRCNLIASFVLLLRSIIIPAKAAYCVVTLCQAALNALWTGPPMSFLAWCV